MPAWFHPGRHPQYSDFIEGVLEDEWNDLSDPDDKDTIYSILVGATQYFRSEIEAAIKLGHVKTINGVFPRAKPSKDNLKDLDGIRFKYFKLW